MPLVLASERGTAMIDQIDLTHTEEYYGELLLGRCGHKVRGVRR